MIESLHIHEACGLRMIVAIDSTARGPALGGCRWRSYPSDAERGARRDAIALARAMTRKAAMAGLALGGGKAVVLGDPRERTREQLLAFGSFVESLGGRYITAADMGTGEEEMAVIAERTRHVVGLPMRLGGCGSPSPYTALGVHRAIQTALSQLGLPLEGSRVSVQGAGSVGSLLVLELLESGASVWVCDPNPKVLQGLPAEVHRVGPEEILGVECEVFAPCGPPGVLDDASAAQLPCRIVCGASNNPLAGCEVATLLARRGILYVPDFIANAGGLIHLAVAREGGGPGESLRRLEVIPQNIERVLAWAGEHDVTPAEAAERLASIAAGPDDA